MKPLMKIFLGFLSMLMFEAFCVNSYGQGRISYDYISGSTLKDKLGNKYGSGNMQILSGSYNIPLSIKYNDRKQLTAWNAYIYGAYSTLSNQGEAKDFNPGNILNGSLNISHIRPLSEKWSFIASAGGGIYAPAGEISAKSILANGGIVFVYRLNQNVNIGIGAGLTNSYGVPMVLPMLYFNWQKMSKYEFKIDMSSGLKISAATWLNKRIKVEFTALEMDGMSAVTTIEGKSKIYSTVMLKSYISPSFRINEKTNFFLGIGGNWVRGISISDRSLKGFIDSFKEDDDNPEFGVALRLTAGFQYSF